MNRKVRDAQKLIHADGWFLKRTAGSHMIYKHAVKEGTVVIANHAGDIPLKTWQSILKQAGLR